MEFLGAALNAGVWIGNVFMTMLLAYYIYLSVYGFKKEGRGYAPHAPQTRFLILVPAHNEEAVIGDMVRNLKNLDYPTELYDFYIIADNCDDHTAEIAGALGANVIENRKSSPNAPTGKPLALRKALQHISDYAEKYDLLMLFDADNLMDANILREVNSQFISEDRPEIIQCYLGSKNKEGIVAQFYHVTYTITNRFSNLAKYRLGLNVAVGGTGFAIQTAYLERRGGWTTMSLTEDFEMQVDVTLNGGRILWNNKVRIYDEKPTNLLASLRQRIRWGQGHWFVAFRNTPRLFKMVFQKKVSLGEFMSLFTYMYSMAAPVFFILMVLAGALGLLNPVVYGSALSTAMAAAQASMDAGISHTNVISQLVTTFSALLMLGYSFVLLYWSAERLDNDIKVRPRDLPMILIGYVINLVNVSLAQIIGLLKFRQQNKWVKTRHKIQQRQTLEAS